MVQTAHPPIQAVAFLASVLSVCLVCMPKVFSTLDSDATIEVLTTPRFDDVISKKALGYIRLSIASVIFAVTLHRMTNTQNPMTTPYLESSKLRRTPLLNQGIRSQMMFTAWCWNLLGLTFALNGTITLLSVYNDYSDVPEYLQNLIRCALLTFEMSFPASMMVSSITRYILWPKAKKINDTMGFRNIRSLLQHNGNIVVSLTEVAILGRIPVRLDYIPLCVLLGCVYILHTWNMTHRWLPTKEPQFVYFFFDTTLDKKIVVFVLVALLCVMMMFHCMFVSVTVLVDYLDGDILCNVFVVLGVTSCFCRFRD